jgi:ABC-type amino acid transport substrate-binding protein
VSATPQAPCPTPAGDGKYVGYHVEICQRIIDNIDKAIGKKLEVKYISVTSQNRIPLTQNGTVDIELWPYHQQHSTAIRN